MIEEKIKKVVVIGSGVMGGAIAAQIANSKTNVVLLDLKSTDADDPSKIARAAKDELLKTKPAPLSHYSSASFIQVGNLDDDLEAIKDADLIIEVIVEKLDIKHKLYKKIAPYINKDAILASNTSTLPLRALAKGVAAELLERFYITHFFNPPRYMELLELVSPSAHDAKMRDFHKKELSDFLERRLGKRVIHCNDTPGFIANRIGCFLLEMAVRAAIERELNPIIIDKIASKYFAFPSTGIFGLYDLIGHDVMNLISKSLTKELPDSDHYNRILQENKLLTALLDSARIGRKAGAGFYKMVKTDGKKDMHFLRFADDSYISSEDAKLPYLPSDAKEFLASKSPYSQYFAHIMQEYFNYAASIIPEVTENPLDIDDAMQLGYAMKYGPFQLSSVMPPELNITANNSTINAAIKDNSAKMAAKLSKPVYDKSVCGSAVYGSSAYGKSVYESDVTKINLTDSGYCLRLSSKMGVLSKPLFEDIIRAIDLAEDNNKPLYIISDAPIFSAGADLKIFLSEIEGGNFDNISKLIKLGQQAMMRLKYAQIDITSAAYGLALGGGAEILLHSRNLILHQNINAGLVEISVGLIPGWGGTKEMFLRGADSTERLHQNISNIIFHRKSSSAEYFNEEYMLNAQVNMNQRYLFEEAVAMNKRPCLQKNRGKIILPKLNLLSVSREQKELDKLQRTVLERFQEIIDRGEHSEEDLLIFEHDIFMDLCKMQYARERIAKVL